MSEGLQGPHHFPMMATTSTGSVAQEFTRRVEGVMTARL
jgi:hypothetical protein